jgi:GH18 family chitinase
MMTYFKNYFERKFLLFTILLITGISSVSAQQRAQKIMGYFQQEKDQTYFQYNKVTHLLYSFLNPNTDGTLGLCYSASSEFLFDYKKFLDVKNRCRAVGTSLYIAVGGADAGSLRASRLASISQNTGYRNTFAIQLIDFCILHNLGGIAIDWEFPSGGANGSATDLANLLSRIKTERDARAPWVQIAVAVNGEYSPSPPAYVNSTALSYADEVHIMTYDLPSNSPYDANNHAAPADALGAANAYNSVYGVPKNKILIGIAFYGRVNTNRYGGTYDYNLLSGAALTNVYNNDNNGTTYYNGVPACNAKVDYIKTQGYDGILIWDLNKDQPIGNANNLLNVIHTRINTTNCPAGTFAVTGLGADQSLCAASANLSVTNASSTFKWYNGVSIVGTSSSYSATQSGVYTVRVKQTANPNCNKTDTMELNLGTTVSGTGATGCGPISLSLSATNSSGRPIKWYDALTGGNLLTTGTSYTTPVLSATTTYYAQDSSYGKSYYGGRPATNGASATAEFASDGAGHPAWYQKLTLTQPATIKAITIYMNSQAGTVTLPNSRIIVMDGSHNLVTQSPTVTVTKSCTYATWSEPHFLTLNLSLNPGTYYVGFYCPTSAVSADITAGRGVLWERNINYPTSAAGVYSIAGQSYGWDVPSSSYTINASYNGYGQLFDWEIVTNPPACARTPVVATINCPAPVELVSFNGYREGSNVRLRWNTASEVNNKNFVIERSADGNVFIPIGSVDALANASSGSFREYTFLDEAPLQATGFYRLAQYDLDGTQTYTQIISVDYESSAIYAVSPNPFENEISILVNKAGLGTVHLTVVNVHGIAVEQGTLEEGENLVSIGSGLSSGIYFLHIQDANAIQTFKIIKK